MPRAPRVPAELTRGPFDLEEARRHGLTRYHLRAASWRSLGGGFYAFCEIADQPLVRLAAAARRLPSGAVFSGRTAAWLHGLDLAPCNPIEVTLPLATPHRGLAGIWIQHSAEIERSIAKRLPVTPRVRTVADLGRRLPLVEAVVAIDMALHIRLVRPELLRGWVETHSGYRGISRLRRALELAEPATESPMETRLRLLLVLAGLPRPHVQVPLQDDKGRFIGRPDLYYPGQRLALEYDGAVHRETMTADHRRQNRLINAGYRPLRFTAADVLSTPDSVVLLVRQALVANDLPAARGVDDGRLHDLDLFQRSRAREERGSVRRVRNGLEDNARRVNEGDLRTRQGS